MRIALVHPKLDVKGGAENIVVWLARALMRRGHIVCIVTRRWKRELWSTEWVDGLDVRLLPDSTRMSWARAFVKSKSWDMGWYAKHLAEAVGDVDCVVADLFPSYVWATLARGRRRAPWRVVWLCQEPKRKYYAEVTDRHLARIEADPLSGGSGLQDRLAAVSRLRPGSLRSWRYSRNTRRDGAAVRRCNLVLANSAFTAQNVRTIFDVDVRVCHLGVPLAAYRPHEPGKYLAVLSSLSSRKNVANVLRALAACVHRPGCGEIVLRIVGSGRQRNELEQLAGSLGIASRVDWLGPIADAAISGFLRGARAVVYVPIDEPFGLTPLEALATATPVIVSDHGGPAELIEHENTGLHVDPFDPEAIATAMARFWTDPALARRLGEAGAGAVRQEFSLDSFVDRLEELLAEGLGSDVKPELSADAKTRSA